MTQSFLLCTQALLLGSRNVHHDTGNAMNTRHDSALLARANHQLAQDLGAPRGKSTLLAISYFACFYPNDCFECLSPHEIAA